MTPGCVFVYMHTHTHIYIERYIFMLWQETLNGAENGTEICFLKAMFLANGGGKRVSGLISLSESRGTDLIPLQRAILS